jgi:hypothetical protein
LRNKPNLRDRLLIRLEVGGFCRAGGGAFRGWRGGFRGWIGSVAGFQTLEFLEGAVVVAADGIDAALETIEDLVGAVEDAALGLLVRVDDALGMVDFVLP